MPVYTQAAQNCSIKTAHYFTRTKPAKPPKNQLAHPPISGVVNLSVIGLILGPLAETQFRRALSISQGDMSVFVTHPISAALLGIALEIGATANNLSESQFGLASTKFRWNVSGTYMQAIPRIFSTDASGSDERDFLAGPVRNSDNKKLC